MQLLLDLPVPPLDLADFIPGDNAILLQVLTQQLQQPHGCLYVWGPSGCGKTHLLEAASSAALRQGLIAGYVDLARESLPAELSAQWLALDNLGALDAEDQLLLFDLYNQAREQNAVLLFASTLPPQQLPLLPDLRTRLAWDLVFPLLPLNDAGRSQALVQHAHHRGFDLPADVADYLIRFWPRDMASLVQALDALDRASLEQHKIITLRWARALLQHPMETS